MAAENNAELDARSIVTTRLIDAPRELVFDAFTNPDHLARWWGPNGFTTTTHAFEMRPGGEWRFTMHGPDGRDYQNRIVYTEVKKPERLMYKHAGEEETEKIKFSTIVTFDDKGGKTLLTMRLSFETAPELTYVLENHGAERGGKQTTTRLDAYLQQLVKG